MYTLSEMKTMTGERIGKTDADYLGRIEDWINGRYDQIQKAMKLEGQIRQDTVTATIGQNYLVLPQDCLVLLSMQDRTNDKDLKPTSQEVANRLYSDIAGTSGIPFTYWLEESSVLAQPTSASTITVKSSEAADTSQTIRMRGRTTSGENQASGSLNGTSSVNLLASCTQVDQVSKDAASNGFVTIYSNSEAVTIAVIYPRSRTARYKRAHLVYVPESALTYHIAYKRRLPRLEFDEDIPVLDCWNALIIGAYADCLYQQRRFSQAAVQEEKFEKLLEDLISEQDIQSEHVVRSIPQVETFGIDT